MFGKCHRKPTGGNELELLKNPPDPLHSNTTLANNLSRFFAPFDNRDSGKRSTTRSAEEEQPMALSIWDVELTLQRFKPDGVSGRVLNNWLDFSTYLSLEVPNA